MLSSMRNSNRRRVILPPCPCGGVCRCHTPSPEMTSFEKKVIFGLLSAVFLFLAYAFIHEKLHPYKGPDYIEVNGQMCEIGYKSDCHLPMSCGHKIAICK